MTKNKVGNMETRVSPKYLDAIRGRALELKVPQNTWTNVAQMMKAEFTEVSLSTLEEYVAACGRSSEYVFGLYKKGKISWSLLREISRSSVDESTRDYIARQVIQRGMTSSQVIALKKILKGGKCSIVEAVKRAVGEIPISERLESARKSTKDLVDIEKEIADLAFHLKSRFLMAESLLPHSSLGKAAGGRILKAAWDIAHAARDTAAFFDAKIKQYFDEIREHEQTELGLAESQRALGDRTHGE